MNIFWLDEDPVLCARMHCDKHVVKMPLELAQLMCTAHRVQGTDNALLYKVTHLNHPCAVWVRAAQDNYMQCYNLFVALLDEYQHRYERKHKCSELLAILQCVPQGLPTGSTPKPLCMPDDSKVGCVVQSYRTYYMKHKRAIVSWTRRYDPHWFEYTS